MKKVLLAIHPAMLEKLDFVAACEHRSRSDLLREAARRYLANFQMPPQPVSLAAVNAKDEELPLVESACR
jgi:metal-responsive CopG/Arc/MetJ family transcriptional regulator